MDQLVIAITSIYIIVQMILIVVIVRQSMVYRRNAHLLILGLGMGIIASIISLVLHFELKSFEKRIFLPMELFLYSLEYLFFYFHFQFSRSMKLNIRLNFPILVSWPIFVIMCLKFSLHAMDEIDELFWDLSYNFIGLYSFIYVSYILYKTVDFAGEIEALVQAFGTTALSIGFLIGGISTPMIRVHLQIDPIISAVMKAVGALIFISIYALNVDYVERAAINIFGIFLFDDIGKSLGFYQLKTRKRRMNKTSPIVPDLIAPFVSAIQAFVKDIFGNDQSLKTIETFDKSIIFQMGNAIHVALITEKPTRNMVISLQKFQEQCEKIFQTSNGSDLGIVDHVKVKEEIIRNFPYVQVLNRKDQH